MTRSLFTATVAVDDALGAPGAQLAKARPPATRAPLIRKVRRLLPTTQTSHSSLFVERQRCYQQRPVRRGEATTVALDRGAAARCRLHSERPSDRVSTRTTISS